MASPETLQGVQATSISLESISSPRISFSVDFLDENDFITISPNSHDGHQDRKIECDQKARNPDFEFLSNNVSGHPMLSADELFFEGKLLPFWQKQHAERLNKIRLKTKDDEIGEEETEVANKEETRGNWFVDDDPSPRPPKCTVLWKELLRLKKQRSASTLSPSSSSSSSSSSNSFPDVATADQEKEAAMGSKEKYMKRIKKGLERTRSASIRIRPMVNVPICTQVKNSALPPLFPIRRGRLDR